MQVKSAAERLAEIFERADGNGDLIPVLAEELLGDYRALRANHTSICEQFDKAIRRTAAMHAAAVGEMREPDRGLVQDVADLRARHLAAMEELAQAVGARDRLGDRIAAAEAAIGCYQHSAKQRIIAGDACDWSTVMRVLDLVHYALDGGAETAATRQPRATDA